MTVHRKDLRKNQLPESFSQSDLDDLIAMGPKVIRKIMSGPYGEANKRIIDGLLAQREPSRRPMSGGRFGTNVVHADVGPISES